MTEKKMTKRDYFNGMLAMAEVVANPKYVEFIQHELELLDRKNGSRKPTGVQVENEVLKDKIMEVLDRPMTATEVMKAIQPYTERELTNQKVSALLRQLKDEGKVTKTTDKRKTLFERA